MITPMDVLFNYAYKRQDLNQWFHDEDMAKDYQDSADFAQQQREALLSALNGSDLQTFERYVANQDMAHDLEQRLLFSEGLALGIYLGSLSARC